MNKLSTEQITSNLAAYKHAMEMRSVAELDYFDEHCNSWMNRGSNEFLSTTLYRLRPTPPEPKWRAWKPEEVPLGSQFRYTTWYPQVRAMILSVNSEGITWADCSNDTTLIRVRFQELVELCEVSLDHGKTWQPAGVRE